MSSEAERRCLSALEEECVRLAAVDSAAEVLGAVLVEARPAAMGTALAGLCAAASRWHAAAAERRAAVAALAAALGLPEQGVARLAAVSEALGHAGARLARTAVRTLRGNARNALLLSQALALSAFVGAHTARAANWTSPQDPGAGAVAVDVRA